MADEDWIMDQLKKAAEKASDIHEHGLACVFLDAMREITRPRLGIKTRKEQEDA